MSCLQPAHGTGDCYTCPTQIALFLPPQCNNCTPHRKSARDLIATNYQGQRMAGVARNERVHGYGGKIRSLAKVSESIFDWKEALENTEPSPPLISKGSFQHIGMPTGDKHFTDVSVDTKRKTRENLTTDDFLNVFSFTCLWVSKVRE